MQEKPKAHNESGTLTARLNHEGPFLVGQKYNLEVTAKDIDFSHAPGVPKQIDIVVHTDGSLRLEDSAEWARTIYTEEPDSKASFELVATKAGDGRVVVQAYFGMHYLTEINFEQAVEETSPAN